MKDIVYIYDKINFTRSVLGEIQSNFNLSFVIDGTKDSAKIIIQNFSGIEIEPLSIIKHQATNTWWVVSHDRVIRYENENRIVNDNEIPAYYYEHELELLGAIELLNARDLTDCGFNQNRYTIERFIGRLIALSTFEFTYNLYSYNNIDLNKVVDYVKTFENYTLLSALREFIDGYNCSIKMTFNEDNNGTITGANFYIVSKTGNIDGTLYEDSDFNNVEQVKTIDKTSFGTSVVSNAENVISTKTKTYPTIGSVKVTGTSETITNKTAVVRLPSNIFRVNWIEFINTHTNIQVFSYDGQNYSVVSTYRFNPVDMVSITNAYNNVLNDLPYSLRSDFQTSFTKDEMSTFGRRRFYYTDKYDPITYEFTSQYPINIRYTWDGHDRQTVLSNSEMKQNAKYPDNVIYYERGKNFISGFDFFNEPDAPNNKNEARFKAGGMEGIVYLGIDNITTYVIAVGDYALNGPTYEDIQPTMEYYNLKSLGVIVNYVPMSDIKIKVDNTLDKRDSNVYNQNGKLTDSVALSKLLLSYSKEIESDNITKYGTYYFNYSNGTITSNIPQVGDLVNINNENYVINNVSMTCYKNEVTNLGTDIGYQVKCEFTMSKNVAVKSMLTTPNTNIRDYGIPQNNNVARKQLYRDFYELDYEQDSSIETPYLTLDKVLNVDNIYLPYQEHTAVIKLTFTESYGGDPKNHWYYQLESTTFIMKKMVYEVVNFNDNNIIGYSNQNVWCGFDITRIIGGFTDLANTPISYVDDNGEVDGIYIQFCTGNQLSNAYDGYREDLGLTTWGNYGPYYSCFIPQNIYDKAVLNHDFSIIESYYKKDALEVPVFEYSCQIDDSKNIIIGENVLDTNEDDAGYMYLYVLAPKNRYNNNNFSSLTFPSVTLNSFNVGECHSVDITKGPCKLEYNDNEIRVTLYQDCVYDLETKNISYTNEVSFSSLNLDNNDLVIARHRFYNSELENIFQTFFIVKTDEHSTATIDIIRDGNYIVNNYTVAKNTTYSNYDVLSIDQYVYLISVDNGWYLDHMDDNGTGDLRDGGFSLEIKTKEYCTFVFHKNEGVDYAEISINGVPLYTLSTDGATLPLTQGLNYSYQVYPLSGYSISSGGSGSGTTSGGIVNINATTSHITHNIKFTVDTTRSCCVKVKIGTGEWETLILSRPYGANETSATKYNVPVGASYQWQWDVNTNITTYGCYAYGTQSGSGTMPNNDLTISIGDVGEKPQRYSFNLAISENTSSVPSANVRMTVYYNGGNTYQVMDINGVTSTNDPNVTIGTRYIAISGNDEITQIRLYFPQSLGSGGMMTYITSRALDDMQGNPMNTPYTFTKYMEQSDVTEISDSHGQYEYLVKQNSPDDFYKLLYLLPPQ